MAPLPKPSARRSNHRASERRIDPKGGSDPLPLPRPAPVGGWLTSSKRYWHAATSSPVAEALWLAGDVLLAERLLRFVDLLARELTKDEPDAARLRLLTGEVSGLEASLGLGGPKARAALRVTTAPARSNRPASVSTLAMDEATLAEVRADAARQLAAEAQP